MSDRRGRRDFLKLCARAAAGAAAMGAAASYSWALENPPRAQLLKPSGAPLTAGDLKLHENWTFQYPWISTPVLMMRLDELEAKQAVLYGKGAQPYVWPGGVGPGGDIVAYLAICAHALSYNSPAASYLSYHKTRNKLTRHGRAITCCVHGSVYDPALGASVLTGPATHPLAAVLLDCEEDGGRLFATGLLGTDLHRAFFRQRRGELRGIYGRRNWRKMVSGPVTAMPLREWSRLVVRC